MVIERRTLAKLMKAAYKDQGYTVARDGTKQESVLLLYAGSWAVEIEWKNIPGEILGLVAEHMKGLPNCGEAFQVRKNECATVIFELAERVPNVEWDMEDTISRTPLTYAGMQVWQTSKRNCVMIAPEMAGLLLDHGRQARFWDNGVALIGLASKAYIKTQEIKPDSMEDYSMNELSKWLWQ